MDRQSKLPVRSGRRGDTERPILNPAQAGVGDALVVSQVAREAGVAPHVVRYYSRIGLLRPSPDPHNGYKLFGHAEIKRLKSIRQAQSLGFTLFEIANLLRWHEESDTSCCEKMRQLLQRHIAENRAKIRHLEALQGRMEQALARWDITGRCPCPFEPTGRSSRSRNAT